MLCRLIRLTLSFTVNYAVTLARVGKYKDSEHHLHIILQADPNHATAASELEKVQRAQRKG